MKIKGLLFLLLFSCQWAFPLAFSSEKEVCASAQTFALEVASQFFDCQASDFTDCFSLDSCLAFPSCYAFNKEGGGFVLVAVNDGFENIVAYSQSGCFVLDRIPENFKFYLSQIVLKATFDAIHDGPQDNLTPIAPLLEDIAWGQQMPYNQCCPKDSYQDCISMAGCLAIAVGQVMRYWKYPRQGVGEHSYFVAKLRKNVSVNFQNATYDWENMLPSYKNDYTAAQAEAVSFLLFHIGVACEMRYSCKGSSADLASTIAQIAQHFGYRYDTIVSNNFKPFFDEELDAGRPILMGGRALYGGGHVFVCDGRDAQGNYHFNWGYEGECNCYCPLARIQPEGKKSWFNDYLRAVIGFRPE